MIRGGSRNIIGREASSASLRRASASFSTSAEAAAAVEQYRALLERRSKLQEVISQLEAKLQDAVDPSSVHECFRAKVIEANNALGIPATDFEQYHSFLDELEQVGDDIHKMKRPGSLSVQAALSFSGSMDNAVPASFDDVAGNPLPSPKEAPSDDSMVSPPANRTGLGGHSCVFVSQASPGASSQSGGRSPEISFVPPPPTPSAM